MPRPHLAARMAAWSARHRRLAIGGWLLFVVAATALGGAVPRAELSEADELTGEAASAQRMLDAHGYDRPVAEMVIVQHRGAVPAAEADRAVDDLLSVLGELPQVENLGDPLDPGAEGLTSADGRSRLVPFEVSGTAEDAERNAAPILRAVDEVADRHPAVRIEQFGQTSAGLALDDALDADLKRAEYLSIPITLAVLLLAFGRAGRRPPPDRPRTLGLRGGDRSAVGRQPGVARHRRRPDRDAPDRARGRRRLLPVLPQARARGA